MEGLSIYDPYFNFHSGKLKYDLIEIFAHQKNEHMRGTVKISKVIFVINGECRITTDSNPEVKLNNNHALFLPVGSRYHITYPKPTSAMIIRIDPFQKLYGCYSLEDLYNVSGTDSGLDISGLLKMTPILRSYVENLYVYIKTGVNNDTLYDIKVKELLYILSAYYSKKELSRFFKPLLNTDNNFASFVLNNWQSVRNAKELAQLSSYCETSFNKKFKKVFGDTPYRWLNEKRSAQVLYKLTHTSKPFKQIADEYKFSSQQQFNDYCIRNFEMTPGNIRNSNPVPVK